MRRMLQADQYSIGRTEESQEVPDMVEEYEKNRVTLQPDGSYRWTCDIDAAYYRSSLMPGAWACVGIAVFILLFGVWLSFRFDDWESFWIYLVCDAVFLLIAGVVFGIAFAFATNPRESYMMTEELVQSGYGRSSVWFHFRHAKRVTVTSQYIELVGKIKHIRVYVPTEDMEMVRGHIMSRLPGDTVIRYG